MPPRKTRATKASQKAASPAPQEQEDETLLARATHAVDAVVSAVSNSAQHVEDAVDKLAHVEVPTVAEIGEKVEGFVDGLHVGNDVGAQLGGGAVEEKGKQAVKGKGKGKAKAVEPEEQEDEEPSAPAPADGASSIKKPTMEERQAKLKELRMKMNASSAANRKDLIAEHQKAKTTAKELAYLEKKKRLAETLRDEADAEDRGEDIQRNKNWTYSIEESENWDRKLAEKDEGANKGFVDEAHRAHQKYGKQTRGFKPDLALYNAQKEQALGLEPGTLTSAGESSSKALRRATPMDAETLYNDSNNLSFADHKPSEEAIDLMVDQLNKDIHARNTSSRKRANEDDGDVTYINDANKVFNKKINRYYDRYTKEIRANFERGTAL